MRRRAYLFAATPDFNAQVHVLTGGRPPDAIFLTHAHIGHYTGLMYLGRESIGARAVPVYATDRMLEYLDTNGPWSQLVALGNIERRVVEFDRTISLGGGVPRFASLTATSSPTRLATVSTDRNDRRSSFPTSTAGRSGSGAFARSRTPSTSLFSTARLRRRRR